MYNCARISQIMQDAPDILFFRLIIMEAKGGVVLQKYDIGDGAIPQ
jgi:hypothetical protein